jgi:D-alanyl-D-alanine carboxypeptidase|tara:strand:- start:390912 stop:392054 length:1143 start_codon:yes stop_codon:yes gene_type:complete
MKCSCCIITLYIALFTGLLLSIALPAKASPLPLKLEIHNILDDYAAQSETAGVSVLLKQGEARHIITSGVANIDTQQTLKPDTRFHIASLTKMFTAVTILHLIETERLTLDAKFTDILGDPFDGRLDNYKDSTIKMALEHSTGMVDFVNNGFDMAAMTKKNTLWTPYEAIAYALDEPATHQAGRAYSYSSTGYLLLGEVIRKITGQQDFNAIFHDIIFAKANMHDTYFPNGKRPRANNLAHGYKRSVGYSRKAVDVTEIEWGEGLADGGLVSTLLDIEKFLNALVMDKTLLRQDMLDIMMSADNKAAYKDGGGRGLMVLNDAPENTQNMPLLYGHTGHYIGYRSLAYINPLNGDMVILFANGEFFPMHRFLQDTGFMILE